MAEFWELILVFNEITSLWNCDHDGTWDTVSSLYNHIPNIINLSKKAKSYCPDTITLQKYQLFDLKSKVKLRSRWNTTHCLMIIHGTPTYQISLIYRKRQEGYESDTITLKKYKLFDLNVKGQRQNVVMFVHDTPSHDYTPTYQISLTYLKRQKGYGPTVNLVYRV
jgi:hypothetical protein